MSFLIQPDALIVSGIVGLLCWAMVIARDLWSMRTRRYGYVARVDYVLLTVGGLLIVHFVVGLWLLASTGSAQ